MTTTVPYCELADLPMAEIPLPDDADKYVISAAEEIDSVIGVRYVTPVVVEENPVNRPTRLLLKKVNAWLAAGRLVLAVDAPNQADQLQQYGIYLVREAQAVLTAIIDGSILLPGVQPIDEATPVITGPQIANLDDASGVESFDAVFGNPASTVITRQRFQPALGWPYTW